MATVVIRVGEASGGSYPLELVTYDDAGKVDGGVPPVPGTVDAAKLDALLAITDADAAGPQLFELLAGSAPGAEWKRRGRDVRTVLDIGPERLRKLPWEAMLDGERTVFAVQSCAMGRFDLAGAAGATRACCEPLRVLLVVGCHPKDPDIDWAKELRAVRGILLRLGQAADEEVLLHPSAGALDQALRDFEPHVLHFIGHGVLDPYAGKPALQVFDAAANAPWRWGAKQIYLTLADFTPRVVFLNACHSANEEEPAFAVAQAFQGSGVAAVVAMSGVVGDEAAATTARHTYSALAAGRPLDDAVREARRQLSMLASPTVQKDWWRPRLLVSTFPDHVLGPPPKALLEPPRFVDRKQPRRDLLRQIATATKQDVGTVLTVVGEEGIGKTELLRWCMAACSVRGHRSVYVDLDRDREKVLDTLDVLDAIRQGTIAAAPQSPAVIAAFRRYLWIAHHLRSGNEAPPLTDQSAVPARVVGALGPGDETMVSRIFAAFCDALSEAARAEPIAIGLDHPIKTAPAAMSEHLVPLLLRPIREGRVPRVCVITAARQGDVHPLGLARDSIALQLERFPPQEWPELAHDLVCVANLSDPAQMIEAFTNRPSFKGQRWKPVQLVKLFQALEADE